MASRDKKLRELILLVARKTQEDPKCGSTKLNKVLFYADFLAFRSLGQSISGQKYQKLERGPAPKRIVPVIESMRAEGLCQWADRDYFGYPLKKLMALREPDLSVFTAKELDLVQSVIEELWQLNATEVSDLSHHFAGWQAAELGEEIPYSSVFVAEPRALSAEEVEWAHEVIDDFAQRRPAAQDR